MNDIKFSILTPVYNVEKYLPQCIESVICQSYNNFELILIDDGSLDGSGKICDEYAGKDSRIKVIHQQNSGVMMARRNALRAASGDYFLVLDSDDYYSNDTLLNVYHSIKKHNCDMVIFNYRKIYYDETVECKPLFPDETIFEGNKKKDLYELAIDSDFLNQLWTKVVSRNIVDIDADYEQYYDLFMGDDILQVAPLLTNAKKIVYIDKYLYNYRMNIGMTRKIKYDQIWDITRARECSTRIYVSTGTNLKSAVYRSYKKYLEVLFKHIVYGYVDSRQKAPEIHAKVFGSEYYKNAKKEAFNDIPLYNRLIINMAERKMYGFIYLCSIALRLRLRLKK